MPKVKELLDTHKQLSTSLLRGVEFEFVEDVLEACPIEELKKDDILISPGQPRRYIYLLLSGGLSVHLNKLMTDPILTLEPGEVAGEMSVVDHQPASAYVVAQEDCRVLVMNEQTIWALVGLGLGLWNNAMATYVLEAVLLFIGLWLYLASTTATRPIGKYGMPVFVIFLLLVNMSNLFGPPMGDSKMALVLSALTAYFLFAGVAFWLDSKRV